MYTPSFQDLKDDTPDRWLKPPALRRHPSRVYSEVESGVTGLGFKPESRGFSPHITLARVRSGRNRDDLVERLRGHTDDSFGGFLVERVKLKRSVLTPRGPVYSTLAGSVSTGF